MALFLTWCLKKSSCFLDVVFHPVSGVYKCEKSWWEWRFAEQSYSWPSPLPASQSLLPSLCSQAVPPFTHLSLSLLTITHHLSLMTLLLLFPSLSQIPPELLQLASAQISKNTTKTLWCVRDIHHPQTLIAFSPVASKLSRKSGKVMQIKQMEIFYSSKMKQFPCSSFREGLSHSCPQSRGRRHCLPCLGYPMPAECPSEVSRRPYAPKHETPVMAPLLDSTVAPSRMPPISFSLSILTSSSEQGFLRDQHPLSHSASFCASFGLQLIPRHSLKWNQGVNTFSKSP